jgi:ATP-binding protein involved in chromosome partitioning
MAYLPCPHCGEQLEVFGSGGGALVAERLTQTLGHEVPLLGQIPIDVRLREGGDRGEPLVLTEPDSEAGKALRGVTERLTTRSRGLAGRSLGLTPTRRG